jgi:flagellar motor switch protein FliN/FliY
MFPQAHRDEMPAMNDETSVTQMTAPLAAMLTDAQPTVGDPDLEIEVARAASSPLGSSMHASVLRIPVAIQVVIGSVRMPLSQVAQLGPGATITLDQKLGTPSVILVNGREVARGELYVLDADGGQLGISVTEVIGGGGNAPA